MVTMSTWFLRVFPCLSPNIFHFFHYYSVLYARPSEERQVALCWFLKNIDEFQDKLKLKSLMLQKAVHPLLFFVKGMIRRSLTEKTLLESESFSSLFRIENDWTEDRLMERCAHRWRDCMSTMYQLASIKKIKSMFILQPVPEFYKKLTFLEKQILENNSISSERRIAWYKYLFNNIESLTVELKSFHDFTDVFSQEKRSIYADFSHFEDIGCEIVAEKICAIILTRWNLT